MEKRDLIARLIRNPRLDGRTVRYDLRKPFDVLVRMRGVEGWRPHLDEFRTAVIQLAEAAWPYNAHHVRLARAGT